MNNNENLIGQFYTCFSKKDFKGMQECYADNAHFNDPVFKGLNAQQVRKMWEMLIKSSNDLQIEFGNIKADDHHGSAEWIAYYTFSATGKKVINNVTASFTFENGKISDHKDDFDFYKWAQQALGLSGILFGRTLFLKNKVRKKAMGKLQSFIKLG